MTESQPNNKKSHLKAQTPLKSSSFEPSPEMLVEQLLAREAGAIQRAEAWKRLKEAERMEEESYTNDDQST